MSQTLLTNALYVPTTILPDTTKLILLKLYLIFSGNNRSATLGVQAFQQGQKPQQPGAQQSPTISPM